MILLNLSHNIYDVLLVETVYVYGVLMVVPPSLQCFTPLSAVAIVDKPPSSEQ